MFLHFEYFILFTAYSNLWNSLLACDTLFTDEVQRWKVSGLN